MKKLIIIIGVLTYGCHAFAQESADGSLNSTSKATQVAAMQKSGTVSDLLSNFYQVSLQNLLGKEGQLSINTTLFGLLDSLNNKIEVDTIYSKYRFARNMQIKINGKLDSSNSKLASFGGGLTYSVINKRDVTNGTALLDNLTPFDTEISALKVEAEKKITFDKKGIIAARITKSLSKFRSTHDPSDLDTIFTNALKMNSTYEKYINAVENEDSLFKLDVSNIGRRPLWTLGFNYQHFSQTSNKDTITIQSDFVVGFGNIKKKLWEFTANANMKSYANDTTLKQMVMLHAETGLNKVLLIDKDGNSQMELKAFASYDKNLNNSQKSIIAANITYRVCILKDLWLPITVKYDPGTGNLFGFVALNVNIDKYKSTN